MYRVQIVYGTAEEGDSSHPHGAPSHIGPAFDAGFLEAAKHFRPGEELDLLEEARSYRDQQRMEYGPDFTIEVVEPVEDPETNTTSWEVVQ